MDSLPLETYLLALVTIGLALVVGRVFGGRLGSLFAVTGATLAAAVCLVAAHFWGWIGLAAAALVVGLLAWRLARAVVWEQGARVLAFFWLLYAALCAVGYLAAGVWGLLFISLPNLALLWAGLYVLAKHILPTQTPEDREQSLRSLVTFTLGTNYPFYLIRDGSAQPRVDGNPYGQFFAGPGVVLADPAHVAVVTDGIAFRRICPPGLSFTGKFERVEEVVDLRPQLRSFYVDARTKDGVPLRVLAFVPFKIQSGRARPTQDGAFPFRAEAVYRAVFGQPVSQREQPACHWDELVPMAADRLLREILRDFTCEQLAAPFDPDATPRITIEDLLIPALTNEVAPWGIEVLGGGIGNLDPAGEVAERRVESWKATWERRRRAWKAEAEADARRTVETARAEAEARFVASVGEVLDRFVDAGDTAALESLRLQMVGALQQMARNLPAQSALPPEAVKTLKLLESRRAGP